MHTHSVWPPSNYQQQSLRDPSLLLYFQVQHHSYSIWNEHFVRPMCITLHLSTLNAISQSWDQSVSLPKSFKNKARNLTSSTARITSFSTLIDDDFFSWMISSVSWLPHRKQCDGAQHEQRKTMAVRLWRHAPQVSTENWDLKSVDKSSAQRHLMMI